MTRKVITDKADMTYNYFALFQQSRGVQPSLRGLWSTECRTVATVASNLSQSARTTAPASICFSREKFPKGISDVGTCCQPPRFIFYSRLE